LAVARSRWPFASAATAGTVWSWPTNPWPARCGEGATPRPQSIRASGFGRAPAAARRATSVRFV